MEGEQARREKVKREKGDGQRVEAGTEDDIAITLSVAEKANAFSASNNGACSDGGSREDECSGSQRCRAGVRTKCGGSS